MGRWSPAPTIIVENNRHKRSRVCLPPSNPNASAGDACSSCGTQWLSSSKMRTPSKPLPAPNRHKMEELPPSIWCSVLGVCSSVRPPAPSSITKCADAVVVGHHTPNTWMHGSSSPTPTPSRYTHPLVSLLPHASHPLPSHFHEL